MDTDLLEKIETTTRAARWAMMRIICLLIAGGALACWGFIWAQQPGAAESRGAALFPLAVGLWFLWGVRWEWPEGARLWREVRRLRMQHDAEGEVASVQCSVFRGEPEAPRSRGAAVAVRRMADGTERRFYAPDPEDERISSPAPYRRR